MTYILKSIGAIAPPEDFDCGESALNDFLLKSAAINESRGLSSTHLFCQQAEDQNEPVVLGYFSLSTVPIDPSDLPKKQTRGYPKYAQDNLTMTLLARLALDKRYRRQGLGGLMLIKVLETVVKSWEYVNSSGLLVHAKNTEVADRFYKIYGFQQLPTNPLNLYMSKSTVTNIVIQTKHPTNYPHE